MTRKLRALSLILFLTAFMLGSKGTSFYLSRAHLGSPAVLTCDLVEDLATRADEHLLPPGGLCRTLRAQLMERTRRYENAALWLVGSSVLLLALSILTLVWSNPAAPASQDVYRRS
jgi:hypothetical protein